MRTPGAGDDSEPTPALITRLVGGSDDGQARPGAGSCAWRGILDTCFELPRRRLPRSPSLRNRRTVKVCGETTWTSRGVPLTPFVRTTRAHCEVSAIGSRRRGRQAFQWSTVFAGPSLVVTLRRRF
jgi:hypothetical protein